MSSNPVLRIEPDAEAVVLGAGTVLLRNGSRMVRAQGLPPDALHAVIDAVDGSRTLEAVVDVLTIRYPREFAETLLQGLIGIMLVADEQPDVTETRTEALGVLGDGRLGAEIARALRERGFASCRRWENGLFASCLTSRFQAAQSERTPLRRAGNAGVRATQTPLTPDDLARLLGGVEFGVCALEWVPYRAQLDVADAALRAGTPVLFVTAARDGAVIGPTHVPGVNACFECERRTSLLDGDVDHGALDELLPLLSCDGLEDDQWSQTERICTEVVREVESMLARPPQGETLSQVIRLPAHRERRTAPVVPRADCSRCGAARDEASTAANTALGRAASADVVARLEFAAAARPAARPAGANCYRTVGVLGGGTAGYLTALTLRARFPEIGVTLIESSRMGVIGVGEATTPRLVEYLHSPADLGRDIVDFHRRVQPVWKLGVLYQWGRPGEYEFPWPFQYGSLLEPYLYEGNISAHCLGALLMAADRVPVFANGDGLHTHLLDRVPFAYHLDNPRFVRYLQEEAERAGIARLDRVIVDAELTRDGEFVDALVAEGGERLMFDLYVDCSGFRSALLERKLRSPFVSYADSLFTDTAVVANVPHNGTVKPYTVAETMDHGWCWNIAFEDEDHRGYVFSSAFCDDEHAEAEMRAKNPGMSDAWTLQFRSGRHEHFCKGNVAAVGNAYAFVEPLASTAIHMLLFELDLLSAYLPGRADEAHRDALNRQANSMWDNLRGWLAVQYRFNRKADTPFWRTCRSEVNLAGAAEHVERFRERAPLSFSTPLPGTPGRSVLARYANDYFSQDYVYDVMLLGQDVPGKHGEPRERPDEWRARMARSRALIPWALSAADALDLARGRPEMLGSLVTSPTSWLGEQLY